MYYVKNNKLYNKNRYEINKRDLFNLIDNKMFIKLNMSNVIYKNYNILEINLISEMNFKYKMFVVCNDYNNLINLRSEMETLKKVKIGFYD